jgi:hypothetical protein
VDVELIGLLRPLADRLRVAGQGAGQTADPRTPAPLVRSRLLAKLALERATFVPRRLDARSKARLRQVVAEAIGDRFVQSNRRTAELTGIDLAS